jgi:putative nucleotidyltransferase with HDIG domain
VRQFARGLRPALDPDEARAVRTLLSATEFQLFAAMDARDRRHSMDMVHWLRARTEPSTALLAAALLHDVGKGRLRAWERAAFVLLGPLPGGARARLARRGGGPRDALWRLEHHARLGAELLAAAGASPRIVELVAHHTEPGPAGGELGWLRAADAAC